MKRNVMAGLACGVIATMAIMGCSRHNDDDDGSGATAESSDSGGGGSGGGGGGGDTGTVSPSEPRPQADLREEDAAAQACDSIAIPRTAFSVAGSVTNAGDVPSGPFRIEIYAMSDLLVPRAMGAIGSVELASLNPGEVAAISLEAPFPALPPGVYQVGWFIDADNVVEESDEANNVVLMSDPVLVEDAWELNDTMATASVLVVDADGALAEGAISRADDEEWFQVENIPGRVHSIALGAPSADYQLEVYAEDGTLLAASIPSAPVASLEWSPAALGTSYIRIFTASGVFDPEGKWGLGFSLR